jgi:uncharacterized protein (DUF2267 family)
MTATTTAAAATSAKKRRCHTPGGTNLGKDNTRPAQRIAAAVLEVLAGARTPGQAAQALAMSLPRYYYWEGRALRGLVENCEAQPKGRQRNPDKELATLQRQHERLQRELSRQQSLVRMAQRTIGLTAPVATPVATKDGKKRRRRRPTVRALATATHLQKQSQEATGATAAPQAETAGE